MDHSVEKRENYSHKEFRQTNSLVTHLVRTLISRNFCQKSMRVFFRNFHTVSMILPHGNYRTLSEKHCQNSIHNAVFVLN